MNTSSPFFRNALRSCGWAVHAWLAGWLRGGLSFLAASLLLLQAQAAVVMVTNTSDSGAGSLRGAVAAAVGGDTIEFAVAGTITLSSGQVLIDKNVTISGPGAGNLTIRGNGAERVFEVANGTTTAISGVTITGGYPDFDLGGGILNRGSLTVSRCVISGNRTWIGYEGAGIMNVGTLAVRESTISGNSGAGGASNGGGISSYGSLTLVGSTISGNTIGGQGEGAGIFCADGSATIANCTISGNTLPFDNGGGIAIRSATVSVTQCTIVGNSAGNGGGIYLPSFFPGTLTLANTIVAGNSATSAGREILASTAATSGGHNLLGQSGETTGQALAGFSPVASDLTATSDGTTPSALSAILATALAGNGGATQTHALPAGSPAIDAGDNAVATNAGLTTDQRGAPFARRNGVVDIGAYEVQALSGVIVVDTTVDENDGNYGPGDLSLREAIALAAANPAFPTITFSDGTNGTINFADGTARTITLGAELAIDSTVTITGPGANVLTVSGNNVSRVFNVGSVTPAINVTISGLTIANGRQASSTGANVSQPPQQGGGIFSVCTGTLSIVGCTVSGNTAISGDSGAVAVGAGMGGGIFAGAGVLQLTGSTFSHNTSQGGQGFDVRAGFGLGGAVCTEGSTAVNAVNCTFTANAATGGAAQADIGGNALGGGFYHGGGGGALLTNCTVAGNSATGGAGTTGGPSNGQGGGIHRASTGPVTLVNTIVAANTANTANPDVSGAFASSGHNLIGALGTATGFANGANGDQVGTVVAPINPQLGSLANNGGATMTMALQVSPPSPAINAGGAVAGITTDQRGKLRPQFGVADVGAYELTPFDTGQTIVNVGGAFWYLGPDVVGGDWRVYREVPWQIADWVDGGLGVRIGQALDGTVLVENSSGEVYARTGSTTGRGTAWKLLSSVTAGDGATWLLGPDSLGPDFYIYRWAANGAPTYSDGYGTQLTVSSDGSILAQNNAGRLYLRVGSNAGLGSFWQLQNRNPIAGLDTIHRYPTQGVKVLLSTLLANDSDPDGDTLLAITAVNAPASGQATVTLSGGRIFYQPAAGFTGADTFTYQLTDARGGTAIGTVNVDITGDDRPAQNITKIELRPDGSAGITFAAIPGRTYRVQSTDSLAPANWQTLATVTADAQGRIEIIDPPPLPPARFYRTVAQ